METHLIDRLDFLRLVFGEPMEVFASLVRSAIVPSKGCEFFCGDYSSIEARVLFWMADHEHGLNTYREGRDAYREMATAIYNINHVEDVTKDQREVGKRAVLGCGYGMGHKKFAETCKQYGMPVDERLAQTAVKAYRKTHELVPTLWSNLENAAIAATKNPGKSYTINHTKWFVKNRFLWCELPSGRRLAYFDPSIAHKETSWGEKRPALYHYSVHPKTRKWVNDGTYGGKLTENVVQAVARDLMAEAMLRLNKAGYKVRLSVHDELLTERIVGQGQVEEFEKLMATAPLWATGLPIKVDAWHGPRYRK